MREFESLQGHFIRSAYFISSWLLLLELLSSHRTETSFVFSGLTPLFDSNNTVDIPIRGLVSNKFEEGSLANPDKIYEIR